MSDFLKNLKAGDAVVLCEYYCGSGHVYSEATVEKVTPSGLIKVNGKLYNGKTGYLRQRSSWSSVRLCDPNDPEVKKRVTECKEKRFISAVLSKMSDLDDDEITMSQAKQICKIMGW